VFSTTLWIALAVPSLSVSAVALPSGAVVELAVGVTLFFVQPALSNASLQPRMFFRTYG
jgi:hypothetical protein